MRNCRIKYATFLLSIASAGLVLEPQLAFATENDPGVWLTFSTTDAIQSDGEDTRWRYWFDAQARYFDIGSGVNQWLARPGIGYRISDTTTGWIGYARFRSRNSAGNVATEDRYWQQVDWSAGSWNDGRLAMRVRLEQRSVSVGDDVGVVFRFMAKYTRPIGVSGDTNLIIGIEPFFDLRDTDWGGDSGLGQNRTFIGLGKRINDRVAIEAGYMNQYLWRDNAENRINHLGVVSFKVRL